IYTAHWDHLGRHPELQGDQIFNGAIDNASGVASVIELGGAFTKLNPPPKRSVLFMATTAEEAGLLGAKYYTQHPLYPLEKPLAALRSSANRRSTANRSATNTPRNITTSRPTKLIPPGISPAQCEMFNFCSKLATKSRTATKFQSGNPIRNLERNTIRY